MKPIAVGHMTKHSERTLSLGSFDVHEDSTSFITLLSADVSYSISTSMRKSYQQSKYILN